MIITICGSIKFMDDMRKIEKELLKMGHKVFMPVKAKGVDYWEENNVKRVAAKKKFNLIGEHMAKIEKSDAILVVNVDKNDIKNYIGANTFLEMGFAFYKNKKIYTLNPLPKQNYIIDELLTINPINLKGEVSNLK